MPLSFHSRAVLYAKVATCGYLNYKLIKFKKLLNHTSHILRAQHSHLASGYRVWRADIQYFLYCGKFYQIALLQRLLFAQLIFKASSRKILWNDVSETYL